MMMMKRQMMKMKFSAPAYTLAVLRTTMMITYASAEGQMVQQQAMTMMMMSDDVLPKMYEKQKQQNCKLKI